MINVKLINEEELKKYGIKSISAIVEATWSPRIFVKFIDKTEIILIHDKREKKINIENILNYILNSSEYRDYQKL